MRWNLYTFYQENTRDIVCWSLVEVMATERKDKEESNEIGQCCNQEEFQCMLKRNYQKDLI